MPRPVWKLRPDGKAWKSLPVGAERIRAWGHNGKQCWFIKVSDDCCAGKENHWKAAYQWEKKHTWLWRNTYGEIPKGHKIIFLNGDTLDCRLENLFLATDAANMMMTKYGWFSEDPNITKTALLCCELEILSKKENNQWKQ